VRVNPPCRRWIPRARWPAPHCGMRWQGEQNDIYPKIKE
jgi:hypothetical protein